MAQAKKGDTVKVHYTGTLNDGTEFDSSAGRDPLEFTLGQGQIIPGFEQAILDMSPGDTKTVEIAVEEAYGPRQEKLVIEVNKDELPSDLDPSVGDQLEMKQGEQVFIVRVTDVSTDTVTLDANHPLAGHALTFDIELVDIA